jgi:hypothetical protein
MEEYEEEQDGMASAKGKTRMVDWLQCCKLPVALSVIGFLVLYGVTGDLRSGSKSILMRQFRVLGRTKLS